MLEYNLVCDFDSLNSKRVPKHPILKLEFLYNQNLAFINYYEGSKERAY